MPVTLEVQRELEAKMSHYGCGWDSCQACYPLQYACEFCAEQFPSPILNGERHECEDCEWVNNDTEARH